MQLRDSACSKAQVCVTACASLLQQHLETTPCSFVSHRQCSTRRPGLQQHPAAAACRAPCSSPLQQHAAQLLGLQQHSKSPATAPAASPCNCCGSTLQARHNSESRPAAAPQQHLAAWSESEPATAPCSSTLQQHPATSFQLSGAKNWTLRNNQVKQNQSLLWAPALCDCLAFWPCFYFNKLS